MEDDADKPNYEDDADKTGYEVGYGKPPRETRFAKGQSGNPRGRPRGSKSFRILLEEEWREKVTVVVNGKRQRISKKKLLVKGAVSRAVANHDYKGLVALKAFDEPAPIVEQTPVYPPTFTLKLEEDPPEEDA
mgnify:CR=1 FL=1